ncbi:ras-related protein Rab-38-like isoform X2 [Pocillopora verrucosa]|uniref:ras-related protein Rab-38-like isoform X2 n=1 Tax=Pocillopora verrucosa TaxID=203993 RepID=UPI00279747A2|nr:ras-related protein Rab-38-like isoform X4 [Pocillopora verrucosa]
MDAKEHLYKVLVIGEYGVGKTSIIRRYTEGSFTPNYKLTIGVDFALKVLYWDEMTKINLQLWDVAGHERFGHMTRVYYKYAIAAIIVFDLTRPPTFDAVLKWHWDVNQKVMLTNEKPIPVLLLANKCDLKEHPYDEERLNQFCQEHGFIGWFPTSAKEDQNIDEAMQLLVQAILSVSGESKTPNLNDCIALRGTVLQSSSLMSYDSRYMVDFSQKYQTDESYSQSVPPSKERKCCPG